MDIFLLKIFWYLLKWNCNELFIIFILYIYRNIFRIWANFMIMYLDQSRKRILEMNNFLNYNMDLNKFSNVWNYFNFVTKEQLLNLDQSSNQKKKLIINFFSTSPIFIKFLPSPNSKFKVAKVTMQNEIIVWI